MRKLKTNLEVERIQQDELHKKIYLLERQKANAMMVTTTIMDFVIQGEALDPLILKGRLEEILNTQKCLREETKRQEAKEWEILLTKMTIPVLKRDRVVTLGLSDTPGSKRRKLNPDPWIFVPRS